MMPRIPPPAVALAAAVLMWIVARATPAWRLSISGRTEWAVALALLGVAITLAGVVEFVRARTTLNPLDPAAASALVKTGIYRYTRNPMYLGFALALVGWAVHLSSPLALLGVAGFVAYIDRFQITPEEKALRTLFPGSFDAYARQTSRWI